MEIIFKGAKGSRCYRIELDKDNNFLDNGTNRAGDACHGKPHLQTLKLLFEYNNVMVSEDEFNQWLEFCASCGFKNRGYSIEEIDAKIGYKDVKGKFYSVILHKDDYVNDTHLFAAITVIRMISYCISGSAYLRDSQGVVTNVCNLIAKNPNEDPLRLLLLAHKECADCGHFLLDYTMTLSDIKSTELESLMKSRGDSSSLNDFFSRINPKSRKDFKEIIW